MLPGPAFRWSRCPYGNRRPAQVLRSWAVADVLDYQRFTAGDNAVIKVNPVKELPALVVSDETPTLGSR